MPTESESPRKKKHPWLVWAILAGLIMLLGVGVLVVALTTRVIHISGPQPITVEDVILTTGVDAQQEPVDQVAHFTPTIRTMYCVVKMSAPKPIPVVVRWYYQETLIGEESQTIDRTGVWWIRRTERPSFPEGPYRVEVYLYGYLVRTAHFTVGQ